ncbi:MAG TPA: hypothetical protein VLN47_03905, partial [Clostridiaceae bacterium]|nr:hypothetical protein [Clostridiaceae bacterium]
REGKIGFFRRDMGKVSKVWSRGCGGMKERGTGEERRFTCGLGDLTFPFEGCLQSMKSLDFGV